MTENKAKREAPSGEPIFVCVKEGKVRIAIGEEVRSFDPSCLVVESAARFLALGDVRSGVRVAPSVDYPDSSKDGETYGADIRGWLTAALVHAWTLRELAAIRRLRAGGL